MNLFTRIASSLTVGDPGADPPVFMGPIITADARDAVFAFQNMIDADTSADVVLRSEAASTLPHGYGLTPGIARVASFTNAEDGSPGADCEIFGPFARVATAAHLDDALHLARSRYGLAASIFTKDVAAQQTFLRECRAGCLNINTGTAGASGKLPFGGLGLSGNHRPAAAFAHDYCAYPVASMIEKTDAAPLSPGMTFDDAWLD